jgi:hypothetical protein
MQRADKIANRLHDLWKGTTNGTVLFLPQPRADFSKSFARYRFTSFHQPQRGPDRALAFRDDPLESPALALGHQRDGVAVSHDRQAGCSINGANPQSVKAMIEGPQPRPPRRG